MSKAKKFNAVEEQYLMQNKDLPPATLAKALSTTVERVIEFIGKQEKSNHFDNVVGRQKDKSNKPRAVIMTEAAAQVGDKAPKKKPFNPDYMHRPKS